VAEIGFYHLTRGGVDTALPALLGRTLAAGKRALVLCGSAERVSALDTALWLSQNPDWLPHGADGGADADRQPIWLTEHDAAPNAASFLFLIDGMTSARLAAFERVFDLFDGRDDDAVQAARARWSAAKTAGHGLAYWQQTETGWVKKA
jgi:DNA polymerase-3 subunit chi